MIDNELLASLATYVVDGDLSTSELIASLSGPERVNSHTCATGEM